MPGDASGQIMTVLGPIDPARAGVTLTHEHLLIDFTPVLAEPPDPEDRPLMHEKLSLQNIGWVRYHWTSSIDNLKLLEEDVSIGEAERFREAGGATLVDVTSLGLGRNPDALARISRATGLNVVMGAGHYIESTHPPDFATRTVDAVACSIIRDVRTGVDDTGIRSGIIGEIGCSWPLTEQEQKSLRAAVMAAQETGASLLIHPGRNEAAPMQILTAVEKWGGDLRRTVMGHIERTIYSPAALREVAATGAYLNYDLFGHDSSYYPFAPQTYMPSDIQRIEQVEMLASEGHLNQLLFAHDVCSKHRLQAYGGHGWDHIPRRVAPRMLARGFTQEQIDAILVDNPARMLTIA